MALPEEPLKSRIAKILASRRPVPPRPEKVQDPTAKLLDGIYEALSEEDSHLALTRLYELTTHLHLEERVTFELPEPDVDNGDPWDNPD